MLDRISSPISIIAFSIGLGIGYVAVPLLALASGYDAPTVGVLFAISAISQIIGRIQVTWLLARMPDRWVVALAALLLALAYGVLVVSVALPVFLVSMVSLGLARAFYWTGSQTHAVRRGGNAVRGLAVMNTISSVGTLVGPGVGGVLIAVSYSLALTVATVGGLLAAITAAGLVALPTYDRVRPPGAPRIWRRPGVDAACWASFAGGGWRALLNTYVPVVLVGAAQPPETIGALLSLAEATSIGAAVALVRLRPPARAGLFVSTAAIGLSLGAVPFVAGDVALAAILLAISGVGGGLVTTLGPAMAAESVPEGQLAAAISATGTFRAIGLLVLPASIAAGLTVLPIAPAIAIAGLAIIAPTLIVDLVGSRRGAHARQPDAAT